MNNKYIFLDIDGVLNSHIGLEIHDIIDNDVYLEYYWDKLCMNNLIALKLLLKDCKDAKLILCTSWRDFKQLYSAFNYLDIPLWIDILDNTYDKKTNLLEYICNNKISPDDIVIIDDENYLKDIKSIHNRLVKINPHDGLTYSDCAKVCNLLGIVMSTYIL